MFNKKPQLERMADPSINIKALDFEVSQMHLYNKSNRRAWFIARVSILLLVLSWIAIVCMLPLKQTIPYLIRVNNTTGVPDIVTMIKDAKVPDDELWDKYWVAKYLIDRETYDYHTISKEYREVLLLSTINVRKEYMTQFSGPNALDQTYKDDYKIEPSIISIIPSIKVDDSKTYIVRFTKSLIDLKSTDLSKKTETYTATVSFKYEKKASMLDKFRLINPFGFQVLTYRIDKEM